MEILTLKLYTDNIEATTSFYTTIMQFPIISKNDTEVIFQVGNATLTFMLAIENEKQMYHFAFAIPSNQIEEAKLWFTNKVELLSYESEQVVNFENWKAQAIYFYDNNGNILECIARKEQKITSMEPFSEKSILGISEIGIVDEQPQKLAQKIHESLGCEFFKKGPNREDFVAIGDESGLFVISNNQRNWFPTAHRALEFPLSAKVKINNIITEMHFNLK